jgi:prepilin-type N-terminal cleavage/methylation domain-containing protein
MKVKISYKKDFKKGFTLIEALVAVSIVLVGVTTAFSVAQFGISSSSAIRNRITATYLAQEALEGVKNLKDSNLQKIAFQAGQQNRDWLEGIRSHCVDTDCGYTALSQGSFFECDEGGNCAVMYLRYNLLQRPTIGGTETGFERKIRVTERVPGKQAEVQVTITRPNDTKFSPIVIKSLIYNWF